MGGFPDESGVYPRSLWVFPDDLGKLPEDLGGFPDGLGGHPIDLDIHPLLTGTFGDGAEGFRMSFDVPGERLGGRGVVAAGPGKPGGALEVIPGSAGQS